jgi:hypothetical protein
MSNNIDTRPEKMFDKEWPTTTQRLDEKHRPKLAYETSSKEFDDQVPMS